MTALEIAASPLFIAETTENVYIGGVSTQVQVRTLRLNEDNLFEMMKRHLDPYIRDKVILHVDNERRRILDKLSALAPEHADGLMAAAIEAIKAEDTKGRLT